MIDRKACCSPGCINVFTTNVMSHAFLACFYVICMIGSHNILYSIYTCVYHLPLVIRSPKIDGILWPRSHVQSLERMQSIFYLFLACSKQQDSVLNITSELCAAPWIFSTQLSQRYPLISLGTAERWHLNQHVQRRPWSDLILSGPDHCVSHCPPIDSTSPLSESWNARGAHNCMMILSGTAEELHSRRVQIIRSTASNGDSGGNCCHLFGWRMMDGKAGCVWIMVAT